MLARRITRTPPAGDRRGSCVAEVRLFKFLLSHTYWPFESLSFVFLLSSSHERCLRNLSSHDGLQKTWRMVRIMHPGCSQLIFALPAFPRTTAAGDVTPPNGVDYRLVLDACHVVTNDASEEPAGYLSEDREGRDRVPAPSDELAAGEYFYHPVAPSTTTIPNYPIVTDFAAWKFPDMLPDHWIRHELSPEVIADLRHKYKGCKARDMRPVVKCSDNGCVIIGGHLSATQVAHLVFPSHANWFGMNNMWKYSWAGYGTGIHDPANGLTLRTDFVKSLAKHAFVFFPAGEGGFMTYVCHPSLTSYLHDLHRRPIAIPHRVSDAFLYARFACTMIALVSRRSKLNAFPLPPGVPPSRRSALPGRIPRSFRTW
ncbi:hypothetical protein LXA43DRAFT_712865 [Ganoderma leucocontextum]|nr:hypothetical protein LXA43DRAFT_712865 [Ganoderma leucocontextum]